MQQTSDPFQDPINPIVFFDISVGDRLIGRIKFELFREICPKTVENFRQMCTGQFIYNGKPTGYKGSCFYRVIKNTVIQGGDIVNGNGTGSISIYGEYFDDENFDLKHSAPGLLAMVNSGPNTNGCQFMITCSSIKEFNNKYVIFGQVIEGMKIVRMIENVAVDEKYQPKIQCVISECGQM
ncbi:peptidyl-prolyl cis-trans isomerase, putative [Entamoeba histolytica HM-1:IMSS-B]|uniref:Peptidyl-prolyl cis-trans isomerase n=8 Tax=Entamoeba TaxID=5758 RepID=C4M7U6_ENTH1|nr:peptidyl-prolyl cis-trans isomerase, putative [Entamoeba nuttalli P19]XP_654585.1 peptidyl-prolyl cis-trans isomerase, putative [Entamoeba histolytica HM-1:IMSS]EMD46939.1 peptidylprolyl cis-trans isomerase, putative [Entamoeba histolytica KU27]EMH75637.1 peptidyl-prolyl cis-trans isomerase, putative [Entamoeba histolytica HM-1:IMSS-B]EMS13953.1 peptidyl-prolyl cis-trans isomerase [Entamoeba histolytica HM-3:IMSS]ENY63653.1 peptidyl-prolyl cis-trans isomerase, putative [Entamoeba histolytic|eukprot:XP_008857275.1 peptidyl-prolyl cis-trans isomerase, putative [Entamoeba nuttalli P19]